VSADLRALAFRLGGEVSGGQVLCPGPGHCPRDRSLAVRPNGPDNFLVHSFAGDDALVCLHYVREKLGLNVGRPQSYRPSERPARTAPKPSNPLWWRAIWREASDPRGTLVEKYLASRGLPLPEEAASEAIRFHPVCPFGPKTTTPAMVALVRDIRSNEPGAIHRTALDSLGRKREIDGKDRMAVGPTKNGVVKLSPDEEVTYGLAIAEGIETTLSLRLMPDWSASPVWACLFAGNLADFPLLSGIETLVVGVDHDEAGRKAAAQAIMRWHDAGRETFILKAKRRGDDLNDLVRPEG
jgi:putative DNA primase/helicase